MADAFAARAAGMNADAQSASIDRALLDAAVRAQGAVFQQAISAGHEHLFADAVLFVAAAQVEQMRAVVAAVERVVKLPGWEETNPVIPAQAEIQSVENSSAKRSRAGNASSISPLDSRLRGNDATDNAQHSTLGVFYGYDFHLNEQGAHLIEINTNSGGAFLNALLIESQREVTFPGDAVACVDPEQVFLEMFRNEWRLSRGDATLKNVAIVDEHPAAQYLFPEFLLAKAMFERAGIAAHLCDPSALQTRDGGLYLDGNRIDLVYNRLTDFSLQQHPALRQAYLDGRIVMTPNPSHHARYADKRNLARLSDMDGLRTIGATEADIGVLQAGVPQTIVVCPELEAGLWAKRKELFFKPNSGFGSKGAYRGEKITKRVFGEILRSDYVAQQFAPPGGRSVRLHDGAVVPLKYDVRCYVYDGQLQLVAARLYQGQTTNFRTAGGGFALVRVV